MNIWTDGSCSPNPGPGGWGWFNEDTGEQDCGGEYDTTNNRMEMLAIHEALRKLPNGQKVIVHSDSQYCIKGLTAWRSGWKRKSWMKGGAPMVNRDLWLMLEQHVTRLSLDFKWVKGHSGNALNEMVDRLAAEGRSKLIISKPKAKVVTENLATNSNSLDEIISAVREAKNAIQMQQDVLERLELMIVNYSGSGG